MSLSRKEKQFFELLAEQQKGRPRVDFADMRIEDLRKGASMLDVYGDKPRDVPFAEDTIEVNDGYQIPVKIFNPELTEATLIMFPGCGHINQLFDINVAASSRIAESIKARVVVPNLRIAPEVSLDRIIGDAVDVVTKLISNSENVVLTGYSSGAHCAAIVTMLLAENTAFSIKGQVLLNGFYDLTESNMDYYQQEKEDLICQRDSAPYVYAFYGIEKADFGLPRYSPYFAGNMEAFPETVIITGEYNGLRSDSEAFYQKLISNNVDVKRILLKGQSHANFLLNEVLTEGDDPALVIAGEAARITGQ